MRYIAAYLLAVLGGNNSPSEDDVKGILNAGGVNVDDERVSKLVSELSGKSIAEVIAQGKDKLVAVPVTGARAGASASVAPSGADAPKEAAKEAPKETPKEAEPEEEEEDMGFGLFD